MATYRDVTVRLDEELIALAEAEVAERRSVQAEPRTMFSDVVRDALVAYLVF